MINCLITVPVQPSIHVCLFGLVENIIPTVAEPYLVSLSLFYALGKVLTCLPFYKDTYINRGCTKKYDRVWSKWLAEPSSADHRVIYDYMLGFLHDCLCHGDIPPHSVLFSSVLLI